MNRSNPQTARLLSFLCTTCVAAVLVSAATNDAPSTPTGAAAVATPDLAGHVALAATVDLALRDNAELRVFRARREAMLERPVQVRALPNPMLTYGGMDAVDGGRWPNTSEKRLMVQQEFPWHGKRDLREGIAWKDAEAMGLEVETMEQDVLMQVKEAYFDLQGVQQVAAITRGEAGVLQRLAKIAEAAYTTGERTQQDVLKARTEIAMLRQRLLELGAQENTLKAKLNLLLGRAPDAPLGTASTPPATNFTGQVATLAALAMANRPEIRAAETQAARYELERQLMTKETRPDYRLGLEYRRIGNADDMLMFTVSIDLPIWSSKYEAGVREAEKMKAAAEASREAAVQRSHFDVQDAWFKWQTARATAELYRNELIPQSEARLSASEAGYQTGKVDFMDLLESQRFLLNARAMAAMAEGTMGMQMARLERAAGVGLIPAAEVK